ncbi:GAF and ANTAR domain-containing protein [Saccharothrix sp. NPDC042600]|uniref:GAF and ANTAR domain-containing protein n=1 Tax=Saccharothrix TaxID=2071 RepID=UPI0033BFBA22|nr:GAF and ANTAR domain-containing protein [Saccharothrix mutabilis subsp. capreolus]
MTGRDVDRREHTTQGASPVPGGGRWNEVAVRLGRIARSLQDQDSARDTLDEVVRTAVEVIPGAWHAGVTMVVGKRRVHTVARTADIVDRVDQAQYDTGQGPCLDALLQQLTVTVPDLRTESRWPAFAERVRGYGVLSMLSFQLFVGADDLGALTLYSSRPEAFGRDSEDVGLLFATHAAVALATARREEQLFVGMSSRDLIGQAKGILMERHKITADEAFAELTRASQHCNTKLHDVADQLTRTGQLPTRPARDS